MEVEEPSLNSLPTVPQSFRDFILFCCLVVGACGNSSFPAPGPSSLREDPRRCERVYYRTQRRNRYRSRPPQIGEESLRSDWSREPPNSSFPKLAVDFVTRICGVVPPYVDSQEVLFGQRGSLPDGRRAARSRRTAPSPVRFVESRFRRPANHMSHLFGSFGAELISSRREKRTAKTAAAAAVVSCGVYVSGHLAGQAVPESLPLSALSPSTLVAQFYYDTHPQGGSAVRSEECCKGCADAIF